jgi:hypothetical protein
MISLLSRLASQMNILRRRWITMATGLPGVDSCSHVTSTMITNAYNQFGRNPAFWGRYFTDYTTGSDCEYSASAESSLLRNAGIKVLPIARQTANVGGTEQQGYTDGVKNVNDLILTFGSSKIPSAGAYFFLDVEYGTPLSAEYYFGWARGIMSTSDYVTPCIYASRSDTTTFKALEKALTDYGMGCNGLWIAGWFGSGCYSLPDWDTYSSMHTPSYSISTPVLLWQFAAYCNNMDLDEINPNQSSLLNHLITP